MRTKLHWHVQSASSVTTILQRRKKTHPDRMEIKKYCRFCKTHTLHKETK